MAVPWRLLMILGLVCTTETKCSPTSYYKNCWIRRFPGIFIDIDESQRRGAQLLKFYQEETAFKCSRTCCLTRNFSCNLAVFHYDVIQESVNCFHLHCPTLESCVLRRRANVILYNVTKGVDPDLLVFGKYFTSNMRVWPHLSSSRLNTSEALALDKRQFNRLPISPVFSLTPSSTTWVPTAPWVTTSIQTTSPAETTLTDLPTATPHPYVEPTTPGHRATGTESPTAPPRPTSSTLPTTPVLGTTWPHHQVAAPANIDSGKQHPNDTKVYVSRNHTAEEGEGEGEKPATPTPAWHVAARALVVPVVVSGAALLACCSTVLLAFSLRGRRKGNYRTSWRKQRGSMRLIKYVIVRERGLGDSY